MKDVQNTPEAITRLINTLGRLRADGDDPNDVINQSIENSWRGLFPLKGKWKKKEVVATEQSGAMRWLAGKEQANDSAGSEGVCTADPHNG